MASEDNRKVALPPWTLVTSHGLALLYVATHPDATVREIATALELTERRVADIIRDLASADLVLVTRRGRRNQYVVNSDAHFRHPLVRIYLFTASSRPSTLRRLNHVQGREDANEPSLLLLTEDARHASRSASRAAVSEPKLRSIHAANYKN